MQPESAPRVLFMIGAVSLAVAVVMPWLVHPATNGGRDLLDGARGLFVGLSLGLSIVALVAMKGRRRSQ